jgi:hypothetical protein
MSRKTVGLTLLLVAFAVLLVTEPLPVHAASSLLLQQNNIGCKPCSTTLSEQCPLWERVGCGRAGGRSQSGADDQRLSEFGF